MSDLSKTAAELPSAPNNKAGPGRWKPMLLAISVPLGLIAILWFVFREQLVRAVPVETGRVILLEQESSDTTTSQPGKTELLFQASGWVEADPWPVNLAVKENGFVEEVFIKEGESVTNGQIVATLDDTDARLAFEEAEANVRKHEATLVAQRKAAEAAKEEAETAGFRAEAATARLAGKRDTWERLSKTAPGVVSETERVEAEQAVIEFQAEEKAARAALKTMEAKTVQAESNIVVAEAELVAAQKESDIAKLALERMVIRSNMDGIVLRRYVKPGDKRMAGADDPNSAVIASLYNPDYLQVRVDVPIAEAGKMMAGQPTKIFTALLPNRTFTGRITRIVGRADLQRNTLQAKVEIDEPDVRLRPEVLCRVEFWKSASTTGSGMSSLGGHALWIPEAALQSKANEQEVWIVDPLIKTANKRSIKLTSSTRDGFRQIADGVRANEVVVLSSKETLKEGARVKEVSK